MSRIDRLKEYAKPLSGPQGAGRDQENVDYWSNRATRNSQLAPRASDGEMKLPSTGKRVDLRDTEQQPKEARSADKRMVAKADTNHVGSDYMASVRRGS